LNITSQADSYFATALGGRYTHITRQLAEESRQLRTEQQVSEALVVVGKLFGPHELPLACRVDFVVRHPFPVDSGPAGYLVSPLFEVDWVDQTMLLAPNNKIAIFLVESDFLWQKGSHLGKETPGIEMENR
jgi:hypothetical protein